MSQPSRELDISDVQHTPHLTGHVATLHSLPCYISDPPTTSPPKGIVIVIPDSFGWELAQTRVLADNFAKAGYRCLLPDFMDGKRKAP